ncbi:Na/Pi cotransporter family protein [Cohnella sp. CFH 77786]|uniref:Na/Pi cotransporter family protein n=1 Tax=Cohnella sp. CFH 77786 TaxID=2662265 RepID=UPI001C608113|nr:Na/Pi symporter [Cohnella sp. CFH 77786]MBW5444906.1 Na/Pi cotransporter family protein [Cohnella sp. CFH 77786]
MLYVDLLLSSVVGFVLLIGGMKLTEAALSRWAGNRLASWLARATSTPLRGFLFGTAASATLQSSTAVTVLTIGFVNAGWITLSRSFGVILGTNVGTTVTTEIMSLHLHRYGWAVLAVSFAGWLWTAATAEMRTAGKTPSQSMVPLRYGSVALAGFGFLLIGFKILLGMGPLLQQSGSFQSLMEAASNQPLIGMLGAAALTAAVHSSSAVIGMAMVVAGTGSLSPEAGIAVVLGANVGTCFTGLVASLGGGRGGRFVALSQLALNVGGALLFLPLMPMLHEAAERMAPADPSAQIAHAQTIFNVSCSVLALPLAYWPWKRQRPGSE